MTPRSIASIPLCYLSFPPSPHPLSPSPPPPLFASTTHKQTVALHEGRQVTLHLECDAHATSIPHLKARCLLDLVPALKEDLIPSYDLEALLHPPPPPTTGTTASSGTRDELALVGLIKTVRLEHKKSGNALDESSTGASLFAARIADGASLLLEWGAPPATGKALVKFYVRVGTCTQ